MSSPKYPLFMLAAFSMRNKNYPKRVRKFFSGLYASLLLQRQYTTKNVEKMIYHAYRNGYILGAAEYGGDPQRIEDEMPDLIDKEKHEEVKVKGLSEG